MYKFDIRWNGRRFDEPFLWYANLQTAEWEAKELAEDIAAKLGVGHVTVRIRDELDRIQTELSNPSIGAPDQREPG